MSETEAMPAQHTATPLVTVPVAVEADAPTLTASAFLREAALSADYVFLVVTSCLIATFGLLADSTAAIIGAMIIAPLMLPIRGLAFGLLKADLRLIRIGGAALGVGVATAILMSAALGTIVALPELGREVAARTQPNLLDLGVALVAGAVSAYAKLRPRVGDAIAGTAIAVALMPPLCSVGLCLSQGLFAGAWGALLLFLTNLVGIALSCMLVFVAAGLGTHRERTRRALTWAVGLTVFLTLPLGYSLWTLVQQNKLVAATRRVLVTRTITIGQETELLSAKMVWRRAGPEVHVLVRARKIPTPHQVGLLESFLAQELGQKITLVLSVDTVAEVRSLEATPEPQ